jgi:signal transduction histidine kinase
MTVAASRTPALQGEFGLEAIRTTSGLSCAKCRIVPGFGPGSFGRPEAPMTALRELGVVSVGGVTAVDFVDVFQQLIDGLPEQIALVDEQWTILAVNKAWTKTAALYGYEALQPGTDYLAFVKARADEGHGAARPAVDGIMEIEAGSRNSFRYVYHGNDRWEGFTFQLAINRIAIAGKTFATITRYDVTEVMQLRRLREGFSQSLILGQAEERRKIGREVHDSTLQLLTSLSMGLGQLRRAHSPTRTLDLVEDMEQLIGEVHQSIRSISYLTHPPLLADLGLREALRALASGFGRRSEMPITVRFEGDVEFTWQAAEVAIYRIVQEALSNAHRHAHARTIELGLIGRRSMIHAIVKDDGVGLPVVIEKGVGLVGMRDRLAELGGRLTLCRLATGAVIIASLPRSPPLRSIGDLALSA